MFIIQMVVVYDDQEMEFNMPVADGRNTIKWLGLAAAERFTAAIKSRGYRRHREKRGQPKTRTTFARLLPCRVYTAQSTFLHPGKTIQEELTDGERVFVILTNKMPVSPLGRPLRDRWMFIAFNVSGQNAQERTNAIEYEYRYLSYALVINATAKAIAAELEEKKGTKMRLVMISQLYSPEKVESAFERDWAELSHPIYQPIDKITEDPEEKVRVKNVLLAKYVVLVEVFKHYASAGTAQSTGEIDFMEYSIFMHDLRGFNVAIPRDLADKTYVEAILACRGETARATAAMMGVAEFIFVVIRLACARYYHAHSSKDSSGAAWGFGDSSTGSAKVKEANSVHEAVELFMEEVMMPIAHQEVIGLQIKTALDSNEILAVYHDHDANLKAVFDKYSKADDRAGGDALIALLNIHEFIMVLRDAGLMGGSNKEEDELTVKEARQAFAGAQNDLCGGDSSDMPPALYPSEIGAPIEQMTYPEFLEGIARVAVLKWEDASLSLKEKIRRAVTAVSSLLEAAPRDSNIERVS
ncbi:unnamed protein product [Ascophyllum nodosum]